MELIDRAAAIERIKFYCADCNNYGGVVCRACGYGDALDAIDDMPSIDAVPVVRCGECKYCGAVKDDDTCIFCLLHGVGMRKIDFCSYGERRNDGTD